MVTARGPSYHRTKRRNGDVSGVSAIAHDVACRTTITWGSVMPVPRLRLLGGFACESGGALVGLPHGARRLVAFLALRGPAPRPLVAGSLWPDVPDQHAMASLRTGVWRVHRCLPELLVSDDQCLAVSPDLVVDSHELEDRAVRLMRRGSHPALEPLDARETSWVRAATETLWAHELLPGWYEDWVVVERERLGQLRLHALEAGARLLTGLDELDLALRLALEAVRAEPLRESAQAALITVYLAEGNVADAVHQYTSFRTLLERELGVLPSPRLAMLLPRAARRPTRL